MFSVFAGGPIFCADDDGKEEEARGYEGVLQFFEPGSFVSGVCEYSMTLPERPLREKLCIL